MIIFDSETTGLINHASAPLDTQPEIIEVGALKLDDKTLDEIGALSYLVKPKRFPLPVKITEITGITDAHLLGEQAFARRLPELRAFFRGEETVVAHNCSYDVGMMVLELRRLDAVHKFPWPWVQLCTVELNMDVKGYRLKLGDLYEIATGRKPAVAHRAIDDCRTLAEIVRWMRTQNKI
jgi:DNA polymerase III epsilon subunit-like protein